MLERLRTDAATLRTYAEWLLTHDLDMHPGCPETAPDEIADRLDEAAAKIAALRADLATARADALGEAVALALDVAADRRKRQASVTRQQSMFRHMGGAFTAKHIADVLTNRLIDLGEPGLSALNNLKDRTDAD